MPLTKAQELSAALTTLGTTLTAVKADVATRAAIIASQATAVSNLAVTAVGQETDAERHARLSSTLTSTLAYMESALSVALGEVLRHRTAIANDLADGKRWL